MFSKIVFRGRRRDDHLPGRIARQPEVSPDAMHEHGLLAVGDLELHGLDSVVDDVAQGTRIGDPHPPREMRTVGPVYGVVVGRKISQRLSDGCPIHHLSVKDTQLIQVVTAGEEMIRRIAMLRNAWFSCPRLSSAGGIVVRQRKVPPPHHPRGLRVERCAHTLLRSIGHVEAQTAAGHGVRVHIVLAVVARMVPHHVAVHLVAEEVDAVRRRPVWVWHAHHLLGHDDGSWLAERLCDVEVGKGRRQEREARVECPAGPVDGIAQRVVRVVVGEKFASSCVFVGRTSVKKGVPLPVQAVPGASGPAAAPG